MQAPAPEGAGAPARVSVLLDCGPPLRPEEGVDVDRLAAAFGTTPEGVEVLYLHETPRCSPHGARPAQIAVRMKSDRMTLAHYQAVLEENERLAAALAKTHEALDTVANQDEAHRRQLHELRSVAAAAASGALAPEPRDMRGGGSPPESARVATQRKLEAANRQLLAEVEELRGRLVSSERFKREVLQTVKDLKKQLATLTEELLNNDLEVEDVEGSDPEE